MSTDRSAFALLVIGAALTASLAHAQARTLTAPELDELDAIEEKLAPSACDGMKLAFEMIVISGIGDVARATDIEARMAKGRQRPPEIEALAKRKTELLMGRQFPAPGSDAHLAYSERRARREAYCPWRKLEIPYDLPPAQNAAQARDYALGAIRAAVQWLGWDTRFVDALPTALVKPFSGSAARALLIETMQTHGVDSFAALLAATVQGSTETTFYVLAVYFGAVGIQRARHAVACALLAELAGVLAAIAVCYRFFG